MSKIYCTKKARTGFRLPKIKPTFDIVENKKRPFVRISNNIIRVKQG